MRQFKVLFFVLLTLVGVIFANFPTSYEIPGGNDTQMLLQSNGGSIEIQFENGKTDIRNLHPRVKAVLDSLNEGGIVLAIHGCYSVDGITPIGVNEGVGRKRAESATRYVSHYVYVPVAGFGTKVIITWGIRANSYAAQEIKKVQYDLDLAAGKITPNNDQNSEPDSVQIILASALVTIKAMGQKIETLEGQIKTLEFVKNDEKKGGVDSSRPANEETSNLLNKESGDSGEYVRKSDVEKLVADAVARLLEGNQRPVTGRDTTLAIVQKEDVVGGGIITGVQYSVTTPKYTSASISQKPLVVKGVVDVGEFSTEVYKGFLYPLNIGLCYNLTKHLSVSPFVGFEKAECPEGKAETGCELPSSPPKTSVGLNILWGWNISKTLNVATGMHYESSLTHNYGVLTPTVRFGAKFFGGKCRVWVGTYLFPIYKGKGESEFAGTKPTFGLSYRF